jgi:hypothetical protein
MDRFRLARMCVSVLALVGSAAAVAVVGGSAPAGAAAGVSGPHCTFNGSALPIVMGASGGEKVVVSCTGLPPLHPYLTMETSLLLGIDPKAAPLLSGSVTSVPGLLALLAALPEINPAALTFPVSDLSGDLDFTYTLPTSHAADPNAVCPPTTAQINAGLIGCGLATIDLTSFKPVGAASAVSEYAGDPLFPPAPTLALSTAAATDGSAVAVGDAPGATTYWWLSTLETLESLLGGGAGPAPTVTVTLTKGARTVTAPNTITVSPAVYNEPVLTPPAISGTFTVPAKTNGARTVTVTYQASLLGFALNNSATASLKVRR